MNYIYALFSISVMFFCEGIYGQLTTRQQAYDKWRGNRIGLFIHWGPSSGKALQHAHSHGRKSALNPHGDVPAAVYDTFYRSFNPINYDPDKWLKLAHEAGMRYTVFVAKHHDGFCMFNTKATDYNIMATPYKKDVAKLFAEACRRQGLDLGWQISPKDWKNPDYNTGNHDRYNQYYIQLIDDLTKNYGPVSVLWFDGIEPVSLSKWTKVINEIPEMVYKRNRYTMLGTHGAVKNDFVSFEMAVGPFDRKNPWETCEPINPSGWVYNKPMPAFPFRDLLRTMVYTISRDGNYLLDVGPMENGNLYPPDAQRLQEFADWMKVNGEAVHGTRGGPYRDGEWGGATCSKNYVYLFISNKVGNVLTLPSLPAKIVSVKRLDGKLIKWTRKKNQLSFNFTDRNNSARADFTVVRVQINRAAFNLPIIDGQKNLATAVNITSSPLRESNQALFGAPLLFDNLGETAWEPALQDSVATLSIDLGSTTIINSLAMSEKGQVEEWNHTYCFTLSIRDNDQEEWKTIIERNSVLGAPPILSFDETKTRFIKLAFKKRPGQRLQIAELRIMPPL